MEKNIGGSIGISKPESAIKGVILKLRCESFGDSLCATPTLRKLHQAYGKKIIVCSHKPFIFKNNPYVDYHIHANDFDEELRSQYEILETFQVDKDWDYIYGNGTKMKYGAVDIRKIHCVNLGFDLKPSEMHCEYYPDPVNFEEPDKEFIDNESYVVIHVSQTWPSRTWPRSSYESLIKDINKAGYKVALIGFDTPTEPGNDYTKDCYNFDNLGFDGVSFLNRTSLDQDFEIIKKANICVTCDTGILHLAGCTDTEIVYIGGSIDPIFRAPYRHGGQSYRFSFVGGECKVFCGSDIKYCISEHGKLNSLPRISECLENKPSYECLPTHKQVFNKIAEINTRNFEEYQEIKKLEKLERTLVDFRSSALGDTLAWIPYVEEYRVKNNHEVFCSTFHNSLFEKVYPEINFIEPGTRVENVSNAVGMGWEEITKGEFSPPIKIRNKELQRTSSFLLGINEHVEAKPKIYIKDKERKIQNKYVCIATQSTCQAKYWNNKDGWKKTIKYLNSLGYEVVCIDKHKEFGTKAQCNCIPEGAIDKTGDLPLDDRVNLIYNCEFFIGLASGLSWLAWALHKEVILISGFSNPDTEFFTPYRVTNNGDICNSCFNRQDGIRKELWESDWDWCPDHKGTDRQHECTKAISFEDVKMQIDKVVEFNGLKKQGLINFTGLTQNILKLGASAEDEGCKIQWQEIFINGLYEKMSTIEKGDVVLDIGANTGFVTAFALWRGASKCYSLEPVPNNFNKLKKWVNSSEDKEKVILLNKALSDKPLLLPENEALKRNGVNKWSPTLVDSIADNERSRQDPKYGPVIEGIKLSEFFKKYPEDKIDFVKLDCEGGEWYLLNNEVELDLFLNKVRKVAMELHLKHESVDFNYSFTFSDKFDKRGFKTKFLDVSGNDITQIIKENGIITRINAHLPSDSEPGIGSKAHDFYNQIIFLAEKK